MLAARRKRSGASPNIVIWVDSVVSPKASLVRGSIPLFSNLGATGPTSGLSFVNATNNMRIDVILTMAESRGLLKILSRPRVVTQNNIQAVVKQGVQVPVEYRRNVEALRRPLPTYLLFCG